MRIKLTYPNVVATLALSLVLSGGAAYAASHLGKNSVGSKQLKMNAVTTAKIKNEAVTAAKVKNGTLTGMQINASTLGTVPNAQAAQTADALAPPEPWHEVGTPSGPPFEGAWQNFREPFESVAFYKDHEGIVHLKGEAKSGGETPVFELPPGFRPGNNKELGFQVGCFGGFVCGDGTGETLINGSGFGATEGAVYPPANAAGVKFDGITFRAES